MCGIAGVMMRDGRPLPDGVLQKLADALHHRGPDGRGELHRGDVGLVHTRLAIIDVGGGKQPISAPDGSAIVVNGEIYNDPDLRREFSTAHYLTGSDSESALHLYRARKENFAGGLRGMYALAIHDPSENKFILARDPFGIKPLYYAETAACFCFASEPQALIAAGLVKPDVNEIVRDEVLALQFSTDTETPFTNIHRLAPGETMIVQNARIIERLEHPDVFAAKAVSRPDRDAVTEFDLDFENAVKAHQRSDVPFGMFLSGGIDSAAVLAMMARLNDAPVLAYTAAFPGTGAHDERENARNAAQAARAEHVEVTVSAADFWENLPQIAAAIDDPAPDYAVVPTFLLAKRAAREVKVVLTGEGGDELFAGYGRYRAVLRRWPFRKTPFRKHILAESGVLRTVPPTWRDGLSAVERALLHGKEGKLHGSSTVLRAYQTADCQTWLPNDLLIKLDRCLMAFGVEGRVPFLDPRMARFAFSLKDEQKVRGPLGKWVVRQWLSENFPAAKAFEHKRGFTVPVGEWIAEDGARLAPLMVKQEGIKQICVPENVEALFKNVNGRNGHAAWTLLFYALWHKRHIEGVKSSGSVFETL